jgi:hypothetical protein
LITQFEITHFLIKKFPTHQVAAEGDKRALCLACDDYSLGKVIEALFATVDGGAHADVAACLGWDPATVVAGLTRREPLERMKAAQALAIIERGRPQ